MHMRHAIACSAIVILSLFSFAARADAATDADVQLLAASLPSPFAFVCFRFPLETEPLPLFRTLRDRVRTYVETREWSCAARSTSTYEGLLEEKGKEFGLELWSSAKAILRAWGADIASKIKGKFQ